MIIDLILDRKEDEACGFKYDPHEFYLGVMNYQNVTPRLARTITSAMVGGTNKDVQDALCEYIDCNGYNENIKKYICSRSWI